MNSIASDHWLVNADDPQVLTRVLALPELAVTHLEVAAWRGWLILHCVPTATEAICPSCAQPSSAIHQYHTRTVRDLSWAGYTCFLQLTRRRFDCAHCALPFTEPLAALAPHARMTCRYSEFLFAQCRERSLQQVVREQELGYKTVEANYYHQAHAQVATPLGLVQRLGIDEIALKKGHGQYALVLSDRDAGRVIALLPERSQAVLEAYLASWSAEQRAAVTDVMVDLWAPYHQAVRRQLPHVRLVADRFHVMKNLNERVNEARRTIQREASATERAHLKGCRWLLVKNVSDLSVTEQAELSNLKQQVPTLGRLHDLKEELRTIFEREVEQASASIRLEEWITAAQASGLSSLSKFVGTLRNWWTAILNYFPERLNSGFVEGLNNKIKLVKRRAFGFRNFAHFRLRVLIECGGTT